MRDVFRKPMSRRQIYFLFISTLALDAMVFPILGLAPDGAWYVVALAICLDIYNAISISRLLGWI